MGDLLLGIPNQLVENQLSNFFEMEQLSKRLNFDHVESLDHYHIGCVILIAALLDH